MSSEVMEVIKNEIKSKPLLYIFITLVGTFITVFGANTMATQAYVDKNDALSRSYSDTRISEVHTTIKEIKSAIKDNNKLIIDMLKAK